MTAAAARYGASLFELAAEERLDERILQELDCAAGCIAAEPAYVRLLSAPNIPRRERRALLDEAFGGQMHPYTVSFLKILCDEGLAAQLPACARAYRDCYNRAHGILEVRAAAAVPLDDAARQRLADKLAAVTGRQIDLTVTVEPELLGGIRLDMDGTRLDGTLRRRLDAIREGLDALTL